MSRLREKTTATLLIAVFMMSILIPIASASNPQGRGTQKLRPKDEVVKGEYIWVWRYMWPRPPHPEIESGTWVTIGWGWGSTTRETLEEILETQELVVVIDGCELVDPMQYYTIEFRQTYWSLSFKYAHPPFREGEHTWSVSGICPGTISGSFTVVERE